MNILYLHGYASCFKPDSNKVKALRKIGVVYGVNLDYGRGYEWVMKIAQDAIQQYNIDLVVGCSMGGWLASHCDYPFVALNPAVSPSESLKKHVDKIENYGGGDHSIDTATLTVYPDMYLRGFGLILLEAGDEIIDSYATQKTLADHYEVHLFKGGSHRFESLHEHLDLLKLHLITAGTARQLEGGP